MFISPTTRFLLVLIPGMIVLSGMTSCTRPGPSGEEERIKLAFDSCQNALLHQQADEAMRYFPRNVDDYLNWLNSGSANSTPPPAPGPQAVASPGVDLLLRTALEKKVPATLRPGLTLGTLVQHITDKRLLNLRNVSEIKLGRVWVNGSSASGEIYYQGTLTALRLPFVKEGNDWKIDLLAVLPSAELLMRVDRAIKDETQDAQVEQLVSKLPSL